MIISVVLLSLLLESWVDEQWRTQSSAFSALFSLSNIWFLVDRLDYFSLSNDANLLLHTWSLSVEEQFYLAFAIVGLLLAQMRRQFGFGRKALTLSVGVFTVASFVVYMLALRRVMEYPDSLSLRDFTKTLIHPFYGPFSRSWEFGVGILVALVRPRSTLRPIVTLAGVVALGVVTLTPSPLVDTPGAANSIVVVATSLILVRESPGVGKRRNVVWWQLSRVGTALGDRSYSIYLWHWPILVLIERIPGLSQVRYASISFVVIFLISELSFRVIERPFQQPSLMVRGRSTLISCWATSLITIIVAANIVTPYLVRASGIENGFIDRGCDPRAMVCVEGSADEGAVLLIGDSHAMFLKEAVLGVSSEAGMGLVICVRECLDEHGATELIRRYSPRSVVVVWAWNSWSDQRVKLLQEVAQVIDTRKLVIVYDNPRFPEWLAPSLFGPQARGVTKVDALAQQAESRRMIRMWLSEHESQSVDLLEHLCDDEFCPVRRGDDYLYVDDNHLSLFGVGLVDEAIGSTIQRTFEVDTAP